MPSPGFLSSLIIIKIMTLTTAHVWGEVEAANKGITEPRGGIDRKVGEPRKSADSRWHHCYADGFPGGSQDVRVSRSDRHALLERLHLACHRQTRSTWRRRDLWRWHAPPQPPATNTLARWKHGARWHIRPCGEYYSPANTNTLDDIPRFWTLALTHVHANTPWRAPALDEYLRTRSLERRRASGEHMVVRHAVLRVRWHWWEREEWKRHHHPR